jgi:RHS repeat-associated protein
MYVAQEHSIYGSSRVGVDNRKDTLYKAGSYSTAWGGANTSRRALGLKSFELANHLGNVLVTVSDKPIYKVSSGTIYFQPEITSASDYYPFGAPLQGRSAAFGGEYRFGFNGKELDGETGSQDYGFRIYDPRLGRFLSVDPESSILAFFSTYNFSINSPMFFTDHLGEHPKVAIILTQESKKSDFSEHKAALESEGFKVVFKKNGQEALQAMKDNSSKESPTENLILLSHGSPGGLSCGSGRGIYTKMELEFYVRADFDWRIGEYQNEFLVSQGLETNPRSKNYNAEVNNKAINENFENWRELKFNEIKLALISEYKNKGKGIEISDIVSAQNNNSFETKNLTIVLGGCNTAGYEVLDDQDIFSTELAINTNSTVIASQGYTKPDHTRNIKTTDKIGTTTSYRQSTGTWIVTDNKGTRVDTKQSTLNLAKPE